MPKEKFKFNSAVYLILQKDDLVLLSRRFNTGWQDGKYTLVAGHIDGNETIAKCMARESLEEIGVIIDPKHLNVVHVMHQFGDGEYIDFYLTASKWRGEPKNTEEEKCDDLRWFSIDNLPKEILPNVKSALLHIKNKETFSEFNW